MRDDSDIARSGPQARPDVARFLQYINSFPVQKAADLTPEAARAFMRTSHQIADLPIGEIAVMRDVVTAGPGGDLTLRLFDTRHKRGPGPVILFLHGGGFVIGDLDIYASFCAELARETGLPVVSVDYRLAPEAPFPAAPLDAIAAARFVADAPAPLGLQPTGLVLVGDSAGGNLAIVTALALRDDPAAVPVTAQWLIYPAADPARGYPSFEDFGEGHFLTRESMLWYVQSYAGDPRDWRYCPMLKDQAGMPPTLVTTAGLDPIRDQGRAYAAACATAGVDMILQEARGIVHGFINLRRALPSAAGDIARGIAALKLLIESQA